MRRREPSQCVCLVTVAALLLAILWSPTQREGPGTVRVRPARPSLGVALPPNCFLLPLDDSSPIQVKALCSEGDEGLVEKALPAVLAPWEWRLPFALLPTSSTEFATNLVLSASTGMTVPLRC